MLGTNLVEDIASFDLIPHTSIYEAKWLRKFKNIVLAARVDGVALWATVWRSGRRCGALVDRVVLTVWRPTLAARTIFLNFLSHLAS